MKWTRFLAIPLALLLISGLESQGLQNTITGLVQDSSGAVIANAIVTVTNVATNVATAVHTDVAGRYTVPGLVVGEYTVKAEAPGMQTVIRRGVVVQADRAQRVDLTLTVGSLAESVEVKSSASDVIVRTEDASTGMVVSAQQVNNLPLKGRDFVTLAQIAPGANEALPGVQNSLARTQSLNLSANGQRMFDNNYRLDGVSMISGYVNGSTFVPSLEALQEVSVQTGQYSAALGTYSGAQVDMVVKSGSNQPHGSAYEFLRNNDLNARQFFDRVSPPPYRFNQFGATLGGPLLVPKLYNGRNKTFFFFAYEGDRVRQLSTGQGTAASAAMRNGDFSQLLPATIIKDPYTGLPFPETSFPPTGLRPRRSSSCSISHCRIFPDNR